MLGLRQLYFVCIIIGLVLSTPLASAQVTVGFSTPSNGALVTAGQSFNITASATASTNFLQYIKISVGGTQIAQKSFSLYDFIYTDSLSTTYAVPANATPGSSLTVTVESTAYNELYIYTRTVIVIVGSGDTTAPAYSGTAGIKSAVRGTDITTANIEWYQATDNVTTSGNMKYEVYYDTNQANVFTAGVKKTVTGALTTTLTGLSAASNYYIGVRAVDEANNRETNARTIMLSTVNAVPAKSWAMYE